MLVVVMYRCLLVELKLHDDIGGGRARNTFDITSVSGTNVTPISSSPTTNEYGIEVF